MKKIISVTLALLMLVSLASVSVVSSNAAESEAFVNVRIEGANTTIGSWKVPFDNSEKVTFDSILDSLAKQELITITGHDKGYITEINGETAGSFGGWDGWYYSVNGTTPSVGVNEYAVNDNDDVVLYYGAYPCQIPVPDYSKANVGIISFKSYDAQYDEYYNATYSWVPVKDAFVTFNGDSDLVYKTDSYGEIKFDTTRFNDNERINIQIDKDDASGAPAVCRFRSDEGFETVFEKTVVSHPVINDFMYMSAMYVNDSQTISPMVMGKTGDGKLTYKSSDNKKATVSAKGKITTKKAGNVKITVKYTEPAGSASKVIRIKIMNPSLKKTSATIKKGKKTTIKVFGTGKFTFKTSNKKIATVTKSGVVKGVKKGKATITVTANGKKLKFNVKVTK